MTKNIDLHTWENKNIPTEKIRKLLQKFNTVKLIFTQKNEINKLAMN